MAERYAELHCHTNFSFLDGASHPEELVDEAARLGLAALGITDHDGFYGVVRFASAARNVGLPTVFGAELTLTGSDHEPSHLVVLAEGPVGYARLAAAISAAQLAGTKGAPSTSVTELAEGARAAVHLHPHVSAANDTWFVLTGCRQGAVPRALTGDGPAAARRELDRLVAAFGRDRVLVELWDHQDPLDRHRNDALSEIAAHAAVEVIATNNVHYATPARRPLATALAAIRSGRSLEDVDGWLPAGSAAHLRSAAEQARRFERWPGAVARSVEVAGTCAFDLRLAAPELPDHHVPPGHTEMTWLRELTYERAHVRYGGKPHLHEQAMRRIAYELDVIDQLGFPGYFLVLVEIVQFCRDHDIYCQGRGSAANSAVCFALGITNADAVELGLLFERFLSLERDGPPDIDVDIEHQRREEVIQYVYERHGPRGPRRSRTSSRTAPGPRCERWRKRWVCHPVVPTHYRGRWTTPRIVRAHSTTWGPRHLVSRSSSRRRCSTSRAISGSTREAWCWPTGRWSSAARSNGRGWRTERCCNGTRRTVPQPGW